MNVMITGCAGFIGSHAVDHFLDAGDRVVGVDCLTYAGTLDNLRTAFESKQFVFYKEDICNTKRVEEVCRDNKVDWIINFAAETHVDNSIDGCDRFIHSNLVGVKSLLECCKKLSTSLLQVSTDEVYGSIGKGSFSETDNLAPKNPYSATKAAAEYMVHAYQNTYDVNYKAVRMSNNFGPRQHQEKLIPTIIKSILTDTKIPVYGTGKNVRDWFYVKDCVKMIRRVLVAGKDCETYNLTHGNEKTNLEIVKRLCDELDAEFKDVVKFVEDRPGHDFRYSISNRKVGALGIDPPTAFKESLQETTSFYKDQADERREQLRAGATVLA